MDSALLIERLRPTFATAPSVAVAWLFGPSSRDAMRSADHVDVAVAFLVGVGSAARGRILVDLASRLARVAAPHGIDVIDLATMGWVFIHRVLKNNKRIVVNDEERRVEFEADALSRYLDWKPTWNIAARQQPADARRWLNEYVGR